ncbi:Rrf2 family transcriptional regulator [Rhizobium sp. BK650]|uniref:Rrf2 family transcriptional regulator n=1 Tax=Rhizobium sp. BK650 TaxID=2586990 RepID=UPI003917BE24
MRLRTQIKQAIHCRGLIAVRSRDSMTTSMLSASFDLPKDSLVKTPQALAHVKVITASCAPGGGYRLRRHARGNVILEIVKAIDGRMDSPSLKGLIPSVDESLTHTVSLTVGRLIEEAEAAWQAVIPRLSVEDLLGRVDPRWQALYGESREQADLGVRSSR